LAFLELLFQFCVLHALLDFALQPNVMASAKSRSSRHHQRVSEDFPPWYYWLGAHSLGHGGAVYLISGSAVLGLVETVLHALIDYFRCEKKISLALDQGLHILCKVAYCIVLV
jgi:hypothetical protein